MHKIAKTPPRHEPSDREESVLSRRRMLGSMLCGGLVAGVALPVIGSEIAKAQTKVAQKDVGYQATPKNDQKCSECQYFLAPHGCQLVDGDISPDGWCQLWAKKA
jgi:High potential iron-sulfur protein